MANTDYITLQPPLHKNYMWKQELSKKKTYHTYDIVIIGQMSPEKPNAAKLVQQLRVCIIKQ